jgi:hypothetical protein
MWFSVRIFPNCILVSGFFEDFINGKNQHVDGYALPIES